MKDIKAHKILVVDDDRINQALVKFGLAEQRYDVVAASDGDEGLKVLQEEKPDLIILDVMMPNMNGHEFVTELKRLDGFARIPVIMLTSNETMEDMFKLEGARAYFVKPVKLPELVAKIREYLGDNPADGE